MIEVRHDKHFVKTWSFLNTTKLTDKIEWLGVDAHRYKFI